MPCPTLNWETMRAYLEGNINLPAETRAHINDCPECQKIIKGMQEGCVSR